ncbi:hypothetical protein O6H91_22G007200 [Diphasiastrum complanatum]|uniref:Uncharacterized protein n=1 Tax=Diphasiastrum complanatum TaxID=34168 RepID=A0ACC2ACF0_DIPCM|nr:hypothetical protein O6H91_22G007200 [Diphasiastrum complanatum]
MEMIMYMWLWIAGLLTIAIACNAWHSLERLKSMKLGIPDGSMGWPIVGETYEYFACHASINPDPFVSLRRKKYGNIFRTHLLGSPTICSVDPDFNKFVLQNEGVLFVSRYPRAIRYLFGDGCILNATGEMHKKLKPKAVAFMQIGKLKDLFRDSVELNVLKTLSTWKDRTVILTEEAALMEFNIIAQMLLSIMPGEAKTSRFDLMAENVNLLGGILSKFQLNLPGTAYGRAVKARQRIHHYISELIEERQRKPSDSYDDFLSLVLKENEDSASGLQLSREQLIDFVLSILVAGCDIPANLFTMAIKYLTECPQALKELKDEHDKIREQKQSGEKLTWDDYRSMTFTQDVFNESLRLSSLVHGLYRKSLKDINYKGMTIPRNWTVLLYTRGVHLSEKFFEEPLRFNPWRWQDKTIKERHFLGFGAGLRHCPGSELGRLELAFFLHHLVTKFRWEPAQADYPTYMPVTRMVKGFPIRVKQL